MQCIVTLVKKSKTVSGDKYAANGLVICVPQSISRSDKEFALIPDIEPAASLYMALYLSTTANCSDL